MLLHDLGVVHVEVLKRDLLQDRRGGRDAEGIGDLLQHRLGGNESFSFNEAERRYGDVRLLGSGLETPPVVKAKKFCEDHAPTLAAHFFPSAKRD